MAENHLPARTIERAFVEDLPSGELEEVRKHLANCFTCDDKLRELKAVHENRLREVSASDFMARLAERPQPRASSRPLALYSAGLMAVAACVVLLAFVRGPSSGVRMKGHGVGIFRKRGGDVALLDGFGSNSKIRVGDALRVSVTLERPEKISAWFVDKNGRVDPLVATPIDFEAGQHELPGSAIVEAPCVDLQLVVTKSGGKMSDAEIKREAELALKNGTAEVLRCDNN